MAGGIRKFIRANNFPWITFKKYWKNSSRSELIFDVFLPIIFSIAILYWTSYYVSDFRVLIEKFQQLSGQIIAAISILAGFNITSITVISAVGGSDRLRNRKDSSGTITIFDMLVVFFTWAVNIQLIVVLLSILLFYIGSFVPETLNRPVPFWGWVFAAFWLTITIHSIFISIRNIKTLYMYVTYKPV